jgi:phage terminase large subunit
MKLKLSQAQRNFAGSKARFPCFCGGFGSGKTFAAILRAVALKSQCVGQNVGYYLPTYGLVNDIAFPRFSEVLDSFGVSFRMVKSPDPYIEVPDWKGRFIFRTMDNPARIIGYEVAHSVCDELDTLTADKARDAWNKIIARNRQKCGMPNTVAVATTPEGFRFVYDRWQKNPTPDYVLYRARTEDNAAHLPDGYINSLRETYPSNLLSAYLDGEFVNLTAGSVYAEFDRALNASSETVQAGETLHIGMDFNVVKGAAVVHVLRGDDPHAVDEYTGVFDTPSMIELIKRDYGKHQIMIYPDASGKSRKSQNASESDIALLKAAGSRGSCGRCSR